MDSNSIQERFGAAALAEGFLVALASPRTLSPDLVRLGMNAALRHPEWAQAMLRDYREGRTDAADFDSVADRFVTHAALEVLQDAAAN